MLNQTDLCIVFPPPAICSCSPYHGRKYIRACGGFVRRVLTAAHVYPLITFGSCINRAGISRSGIIEISERTYCFNGCKDSILQLKCQKPVPASKPRISVPPVSSIKALKVMPSGGASRGQKALATAGIPNIRFASCSNRKVVKSGTSSVGIGPICSV